MNSSVCGQEKQAVLTLAAERPAWGSERLYWRKPIVPEAVITIF